MVTLTMIPVWLLEGLGPTLEMVTGSAKSVIKMPPEATQSAKRAAYSGTRRKFSSDILAAVAARFKMSTGTVGNIQLTQIAITLGRSNAYV